MKEVDEMFTPEGNKMLREDVKEWKESLELEERLSEVIKEECILEEEEMVRVEATIYFSNGYTNTYEGYNARQILKSHLSNSANIELMVCLKDEKGNLFFETINWNNVVKVTFDGIGLGNVNEVMQEVKEVSYMEEGNVSFMISPYFEENEFVDTKDSVKQENLVELEKEVFAVDELINKLNVELIDLDYIVKNLKFGDKNGPEMRSRLENLTERVEYLEEKREGFLKRINDLGGNDNE